jgi:hypothetical protein
MLAIGMVFVCFNGFVERKQAAALQKLAPLMRFVVMAGAPSSK